jgi:hypothetical protein
LVSDLNRGGVTLAAVVEAAFVHVAELHLCNTRHDLLLSALILLADITN